MTSNQNNESEIKKQLSALPPRNMKCDVLLQVGDYSFMARKEVLMLRMDYFRKMFTADMKGKNTCPSSYASIIPLDPEMVDPKVFADILEYVYTFNITFTSFNLESLLKAAIFFSFDELKTKAENFMSDNLHVDTIDLFLRIATKYNLKGLEEQCQTFIMTKMDIILILSSPPLEPRTKHLVAQLEFLGFSELLQALCELSKFEDMFNFSIEWALHDTENRSDRLLELLQMIPLNRLSFNFFKKAISKNPLVMHDNKCWQFLFKSVFDNPHKQQIEEHDPPKQHIEELNPSEQRIEELYVFGGRDGTRLSSMSKYDSSTDEWTELSSMPSQLSHFAYGVIDQKIYVCGGDDGRNYKDDLYVFDTDTHKWNTLKPMKQPRRSCAMAVLDGYLYVAGGCIRKQSLSAVERYCIQNDEWQDVSSMIIKRKGLEFVQMNGFLYALGGNDGTRYLRSIERYSPQTDEWTQLANMHEARCFFGSAVLNNRIYVTEHDLCEEYNPEENRWRTMNSPNECQRAGRLAVFDEKLLVIGGMAGEWKDWKGKTTVEYYDFEKRVWIATKDMNIARCNHGVAVVTRKHTSQ